MIVYLYDPQVNEIFPQDRILFRSQDPSLFRLEVQRGTIIANKILELKNHLDSLRSNSSNYKINRLVIKSHGHSGVVFIGNDITNANVGTVMRPLNGYFENESQIILDGCAIGGSRLSDRSGAPVYHSFTEMYAAFGDDAASYVDNLAPLGSALQPDILRIGNYNNLPRETSIQSAQIVGLGLLYGFLQATGAKRIFAAETRQLIDILQTETAPSGESVAVDMNQYQATAEQTPVFESYNQTVGFEGNFIEMLNTGEFRRIHGGNYGPIIRDFIRQQQSTQAPATSQTNPLDNLSDL